MWALGATLVWVQLGILPNRWTQHFRTYRQRTELRDVSLVPLQKKYFCYLALAKLILGFLLDLIISSTNTSRGINPFCFLSIFFKNSTTRDRLWLWNLRKRFLQSSQSKDLTRAWSRNSRRCSWSLFWRSHAIIQTLRHLSHRDLARGERKSASVVALKYWN